MTDRIPKRRFRSRDWFADPARADMTALYLERFMNYGLTPAELRDGRPIVGIAQSGSDLAPCNRIYLDRSEEHTSELHSLMRTSYAVFCLKQKQRNRTISHTADISSQKH